MKSSLFAVPVAFILGCGPSAPAASPNPAATTKTDIAPASTAQPSAAPADTATAAAPTAAPEAKPEAKPEEKPAPAPSTPPTVTGTLGGKPFTPKAALTMGPLYQGRVLIALADYDMACGKGAEMAEGMRTLALQIEWKPGPVGFTADPKKKGSSNPWHTVVGADKKLKQTRLPATGTVELSAAPQKVGDMTRLKLDIKGGKDTVKGEIDLAVCWEIEDQPAKEAPKK